MEKLIERIKACMKCSEHPSPLVRDLYSEGPWFFPPRGKVQGFFGTSKVMFVAERPSFGKFPSKADKFFYGLLEEHGFSDAHLTDLVKCRGTTGDFDKCKKFLLEEIEILKPELIVAVGRKAYGELKKIDPVSEIKYVKHYSYAVRYNKRDELEIQFKDLRD